jgi:hypothetical protein
MSKYFTIIYGEPVRPSEGLLKLIENKNRVNYFKNERHRINYFSLLIRNTNSKISLYGYSGTKSAIQLITDMYYLQDYINTLRDRASVKEEIKDIFS